MDNFKEKLKEYGEMAWAFIKEKLQRFWVLLRRAWKKYHVTKVGILVVLIIGLGISVMGTIQARTADIDKLHDSLQNTTVIIDDQGEEAGSLYAQKGTFIPLEEISPNIQNAVIATEDKRFESHFGFDLIGIGRAAVGIVLNRGEIVGGGSTITQQLAKNAYLTADQTFTRKIKELFLAIEIEKNYSKDSILEMYLNNSYFGQGVWGVQDASLKYFGKNASELTLTEAATLTGALKAPSNYNPIDHYDAAISRRNVVLSLMVETEFITEEERQVAADAGLTLVDGYNRSDGYSYPYYFDSVITEAVEKYGLDEQAVLNGGYKIYTNLNQAQQQQMDAIYGDESLYETAEDGAFAQSASIGINPQTGGITSVIGGRGEHNVRDFNRSTQMRRRPGSTIKPLSVYAPALEAGWEIDDMVSDELETYGEGDIAYTPENYDFNYVGELPMYEALAVSKNTSAVWLLDQIGINRSIRKLRDFGLPLSKTDNTYGSIALGAMDPEISPLDLASAYSVFANDGVQVEAHFITKIVDATGAVVVDNTNPKAKRVLSKEVNDDMNRMLLYSFSNGIARNIQPAGYEIAGKTGTTETTNSVGIADQWVVGYTPDLVVATWEGYDYVDEESHYLVNTAANGIGRVFKRQMEAMIPYTSQTQFAVDDSDIEVIVRDNTEQDALERLERGIRETGGRVIRGGRRMMDEARKFLDSFLNR